LEVGPGTANRMVSRLRHTIEHSLGALLVSRQARTDPTACPELCAILARWDGRFSVLMRKRVVRHIESCPSCDQERRKLVNPVALLGAAPVFIPAPAWLRDHTLTKIRLTSAVTGTPPGSTEPGGSTAEPGHNQFAAERGEVGDNQSHRIRRLIALVGILAGTVLAILGLTMASLHHPNGHVAPVDVSATAPAPPANTTPPPAVEPAIKPPALPTPGHRGNGQLDRGAGPDVCRTTPVDSAHHQSHRNDPADAHRSARLGGGHNNQICDHTTDHQPNTAHPHPDNQLDTPGSQQRRWHRQRRHRWLLQHARLRHRGHAEIRLVPGDVAWGSPAIVPLGPAPCSGSPLANTVGDNEL
jgi:hypothetical protein